MPSQIRVAVLGSAAGGGYPQWNCRCAVCELAWAEDPRVTRRTQSSIAVSSGGDTWLLLNASPDLRQQIIASKLLQPTSGLRGSPIVGVFLTNGDVDHLAGLLTLREQQPLSIYGSSQILRIVSDNTIFAVLNEALVSRRPVELGSSISAVGLSLTPFAVPGKVPLFLEGEKVEIGAESETTVGLEIRHGDLRAYYIPGCAHLTPALLARLEGADLLLFDGTTFTDDEMVQLGLSAKTARRMGHLAISGPAGSMAGLAAAKITRKVYIHINNSNAILVAGSQQRCAVEAAGWEVAYDGMEITL